VVPVSAFAFAADWSVDAALSVLFFLWLFFEDVEPVSAFALDWSPAVASALFFLPLFFVAVSLAAVEVSAESAADFFLDFDVLLVLVSDAAPWSLFDAVSCFAFLDFFFVVVLVSVVWSLVLAWGFASAGATESANNRQKPAIHVLILMGSLFIEVLMDEGRLEQPPSIELQEARALPPKIRPENAGGMSHARGQPSCQPVSIGVKLGGKTGGIRTALKRSSTSVRTTKKNGVASEPFPRLCA